MQGFADFHTHTTYSHGKGTVADNVAAAHRRGLRQIGISDHGPANLFGVGIAGLGALQALRADIETLKPVYAGELQIFLGIEANVVDLEGTLDLPEEALEHLDYVMVGLHVPVRPRRLADAVRFTALNTAARWSAKTRAKARAMNTEALIRCVSRYPVDAITHPGWRLDIDTPALAEACAEVGTALEVNTSHDHGGLAYIEAAAAQGVDFVVGSDAHHPGRVGDLAAGFDLLRRAGIPPERVRNALGPGGTFSGTAEERMRAGVPAVRGHRARSSSAGR